MAEVSAQTYISLDLETTGLDPKGDEVIEIGAVKFQGSEVITTFHSLVNPHRPVPPSIQLRCGISQAEVDVAPDFSELSDELVSFLSEHPIVGHNILFDLSFLAQKGIKLSNPCYDTLELAKILLPQLPSYALSAVASHLSIPCPVQHRALADAITTKEVFSALLGKALELNLPTIAEIAHFATKANSELAHLFHNIEEQKGEATLSFTELEETKPAISARTPLRPSPGKTPLDIEKLTSIFADGGPLSLAFPNYERRQEQIRMMQAVAQALNDGGQLIVEAGTGTGKSIAYLLPAMLLAVENSAHVVISTNTINLQQQLIDKDIPDLLRALGATLPLAELVAVPVKGRGNYLCLRRWSSLHHEWWLPPEEHRLLARIQAWLDVTQSGDRAELNLSGGEIPTWNKLCAQVDDCWAGNCPYYRRGNCFLFQARKAAEGAHLIVVNHALLLSELAAGTKVLPEYHYLIIDEAHHLEDEVTKQLGSQIGQPQLLNFLSRIEHKVDGQRYIGLLNQLRERLRLSTVMPLRRSHLEQLSDVLRHKANEPRAQALLFFDAARRFLQEHTEEQNLRLTTQVRRSRGWAEVQGLWDDLNLMLKDIEGTLNELYIGLEDLSDERFPDYDSLMLELSSLLHTDGELRRQINSVVSHPEENDIHWLSLRGEDGSVHLCTAPLKVGDILQQRLLCDKEGVVLSGATLSTEGNFNYIKERLGFGDVTEVLLGSPFDYHSAVLLYIAEDIPEPGEPGYQQAVERAIIELCLASEGRTLALFTSYSALKATLAVIRAPLEEKGILVLGQRVDGLPRQLLDSFRSESKAILLGTSSFWEGVDIVGEALSTLVMVRLPFNVPTEPVFAARSETFTDPFAQYALPQAALRFKQGFGRLIRSRSDRGVIAVLDSRLKHKGYGATFLKSIPQCTVISGCTKDLPKTTVEWLKGGSAHFPEVLHLSAEPNEI